MTTYQFGSEPAPEFASPEGTYVLQCISAKSGKSKSSGADQFTLDLFVSKALEGADKDGEGCRIKHWITFTEKGHWFVQKALAAFGIEFSPGREVELTEQSFLNKHIVAHIEKGEKFSNIDVSTMRKVSDEEQADTPTLGEIPF